MRLVYSLARDLFDHLQKLSLRFHAGQRVGDLVQRVMSDSGALKDLVLGVALPAATSVLSLVTMLAVLWNLDPGLASLTLVGRAADAASHPGPSISR